MRKIAILVSAMVGMGLSHAASAADLPARVYTKAPPPQVTYGWTGGYVGGYLGGAFNDGNTVASNPLGGLPATYNTGSTFIGGVTTGYNWQIAPNWLIGYEGDTGYQEFKGSGAFPGSSVVSTTTSNGWFSSMTGRFGYVSGPSLIYAKGGATLTRFDSNLADASTGISIGRKKWVVGYAVGGGWEYMLGNKWSVKAEYLYLGFGDDINPGGLSSTSLGGIHTARVGLNYKWDPLSLLFPR